MRTRRSPRNQDILWRSLGGIVKAPRVSGPIVATLNDGTRVLGKMYHGRPCARTYANRTQAAYAACLNRGSVIQRGRPLYVLMPDNTQAEP